jgi:hypothetical protein
VGSIAKHMGVGPLQVARLIEQGHDLRALAAIDVSGVSTSVMRDLFSAWQAKDPSAHTYRELARRAGFDSARGCPVRRGSWWWRSRCDGYTVTGRRASWLLVV